jgi:single-strand DNA-binding protein
LANVNTITISGNLTRDPELRHTPAGKAVCSLRMASNRSYKNANDEYVDETTYVDVTVWDRFGELVAAKAKSGDSMVVTGRLDYREWEAEDGSKRSAHQVTAAQIDAEFLFRKSDGAGPATAAAPAAQTARDDDIPF